MNTASMDKISNRVLPSTTWLLALILLLQLRALSGVFQIHQIATQLIALHHLLASQVVTLPQL